MSSSSPLQDLVFHGKEGGTIFFVVMDGLGGLPHPKTGLTELESANTPNLIGTPGHDAQRPLLSGLVQAAPALPGHRGPELLPVLSRAPLEEHLIEEFEERQLQQRVIGDD